MSESTVVQLEPTDGRWVELLERCDHDFHHTPQYAALEASRVGGRPVAYAFEEGDAAALMPLVIRDVSSHAGWTDAVSPYGYSGPVFSSSEPALAERALAALLVGMQDAGLCSVLVRLHTLLYQPRDLMKRLGSVVSHGETVWVDLTRSLDEQWADYRGVHRNLIRRAQREGYVATMDPAWDRFEEFYAVYAETMDSFGSDWSGFGREYLLGLKRALGVAVSLCIVEHQGEAAAGGVFTECGGIIQYHFSGTRRSKRKASPSRLMIDHVRRWAVERGARAFHLGGGVGGKADALFRFKGGFSSGRAEFCTWRLIPRQDRYDTLLAQWEHAAGAEAVDAGEFFPAYRRGTAT